FKIYKIMKVKIKFDLNKEEEVWDTSVNEKLPNNIVYLSLKGLNLDSFCCTCSNLHNLRVLDLSNNNLETIYLIQEELPNLEELNLSFNKLISFNSLDSIKRLDISDNEIDTFNCNNNLITLNAINNGMT